MGTDMAGHSDILKSLSQFKSVEDEGADPVSEKEFFRQGDQEKDEGLPVSFLMDREKPGVTKTQVGFFDYVVLPFFRTFVSKVPAAHPLLDGVEANRVMWLQLA